MTKLIFVTVTTQTIHYFQANSHTPSKVACATCNALWLKEHSITRQLRHNEKLLDMREGREINRLETLPVTISCAEHVIQCRIENLGLQYNNVTIPVGELCK